MLAGAAVIGVNSLDYFFGDVIHPFIDERLPLPAEGLWLGALYVHVGCAVLSLPGCLVLLSHRVLHTARSVHRWLGRLVFLLIVGGVVPTGTYLSFFAKGGWPTTLGFLVSAAITFAAMSRALGAARRRAFATHRRFVFHVAAQLSVAVSSRAMLVGLDALGIEPTAAYITALWVAVVLSAAVAEWVSRSSFFVERSRHVSSSRVHGVLAGVVSGSRQSTTTSSVVT
jgi:hypothetical protein